MAENMNDLPPVPREIPPFYVGIILLGRSGDLLLQLRDNKSWIVNPGKVGTFGGGGHEGETPVDAVIREVKEETNIDLAPGDLFHLYEYTSHFQNDVSIPVTMFGTIDAPEDDLIITEGQLVRLKPGHFPTENMTKGALRAVPIFFEECAKRGRELIAS